MPEGMTLMGLVHSKRADARQAGEEAARRRAKVGESNDQPHHCDEDDYGDDEVSPIERQRRKPLNNDLLACRKQWHADRAESEDEDEQGALRATECAVDTLAGPPPALLGNGKIGGAGRSRA